MSQRTAVRRGAAFGAIVLALAGCSVTAGGDVTDVSAGEAIVVSGSEPQNPLVPTNTNDLGGGTIIDALFTGLVQFNPSTLAPENAVASAITSTDQRVWKIKLEPGWTFSDGTAVTADSFIDAWNYGAYGPNAQLNQDYFAPIAGFAAVSGKAPTRKTLAGLVKTSSAEFTVTLASANSQFPLLLGVSAFAPLPEAFFDDPQAFEQRPVGNGPFQFVSWQHGQAINLARFDKYPGAHKAQVAHVTVKLYESDAQAYADLQEDKVDVVAREPSSALSARQFSTDFGDRVVTQTAGSIGTLTFPLRDKRFNNADVQAAFSMAIDRSAIVRSVFEGSQEVASGWAPPVAAGYSPDVCGANCVFDEARAKAMLAKGGGFSGPITIGYDAAAENETWAEAACQSIQSTLGVICTGKPYPDFATYQVAIDSHQMTGLFYTEWTMEYPSIENFLEPLYTSGAPNNFGGYSNPQFDALVAAGANEANPAALTTFSKAEGILAQDMPTIPLWFEKAVAGYSQRVRSVGFTPFSRVNLAGIQAN